MLSDTNSERTTTVGASFRVRDHGRTEHHSIPTGPVFLPRVGAARRRGGAQNDRAFSSPCHSKNPQEIDRTRSISYMYTYKHVCSTIVAMTRKLS